MEDEIFYNEKKYNLITYIINLSNNKKLDKYKIVKTIYFADKEHLKKYGRFISDDRYVKMKYGPVPSNILKIIKNNNIFTVNGFNEISSSHILNTDYLSESEIECIIDAFNTVNPLTFGEIMDMTHDDMYNKRNINDTFTIDDFISSLNLDGLMKEYIKLSIENNSELVAYEIR